VGTFRRPKGSYVRQTPDWYIQEGSCVGGIITVVSPPVPSLDLFNNASDGTLLHVYQVIVGAQGYGPYALQTLQGHGANLITNAFPVVADDARPWGQLYWDSQTAAQTWVSGSPADGQNYGSNYALDATGSTIDSLQTTGPISVLPPGYSLRVWYPNNFGVGTHATLSASFRYVEVMDRG